MACRKSWGLPHRSLSIDRMERACCMFEKIFKLSAHHTSIKTECVAGLSTFLAMSYIIFVNPAVLSMAGMDKGAVFVATCLMAAFSSALMGLLANYPICLAPGMALNTYFTYGVVLGAGHSWQVALGAVFISGCIFLLLSFLPVREYLINGIPKSLKIAIVAGIGLFLGAIGLKNAGVLIINGPDVVNLSTLTQPTTLLALGGFVLIFILESRNIMGSILMSILAITALSALLGYNHLAAPFSKPPSLAPIFLQLDLKNAFTLGMSTIIFAFLFVDFFDNTGTLIAVAHQAKLLDPTGNLPRLNRVLIADSTAAIISSLLGTSTTTSYLESAVGAKMGGKTGLTALVVAVFFLMALFMSPLANAIPVYATAPAIAYIACLMVRAFTEIPWDDITEYAPALITAVAMPLTFSIAEGISFGFISYVIIKLVARRHKDLTPAMVILALLFLLRALLS